MALIAHQLLIQQPQQTLPFYQQQFGMELTDRFSSPMGEHYRLRFPDQDSRQAALELIHAPGQALTIAAQPSQSEGYWKIGIAVPDIHTARKRLLQSGIETGAVFTVPDVATLCHLKDPEGYCIELLEYSSDTAADSDLALGGEARLLLSTYRVKDPQRSLEYYRQQGWHLLSRQKITSRRMTLYFLAPVNESLPVDDIDAIENRDWLWQRPYTLIEWQHIWGTENSESFSFNTDISGGFAGLVLQEHSTVSEISHLTDPDGYRLQLQSDT